MSKAVLYHLFNDQTYCDESWCVHLRTGSEETDENGVVINDNVLKEGEASKTLTNAGDSENNKLSYYRCKIEHAE